MKHVTNRLIVIMVLILSSNYIMAAADVILFNQNGIQFGIYTEAFTIGDHTIAWVSCPAKDEEYSGDIVIPETVEYENKTYTVTEIGASAFAKQDKITSLYLPKTITTIKRSAFYNCTIPQLVIPETVTNIEGAAFESLKTNLYVYGSYKDWSFLAGQSKSNFVYVHSKYISLATEKFNGSVSGLERYWIDEQSETLLGSITFKLKTNIKSLMQKPTISGNPHYQTTRSSSDERIVIKTNGKEYPGMLSSTFTIEDLLPATKYDVDIVYEEEGETVTLKDSIRTAVPTYTLDFLEKTSGSITYKNITASEDKSLTPSEVGVYCAETDSYYKADIKGCATIDNLTPYSTYTIFPYATYKGKELVDNSSKKERTVMPALSANVICNQTNLRVVSFNFTGANTNEKPIKSEVYMPYEKAPTYDGKTAVFENLLPKTTYTLAFYAEYANGTVVTSYSKYTTAGTNPSYGVKEKTTTSIKLRAWFKIGTAHLEKAYIQGFPETTITEYPKEGELFITLSHLIPDNGYRPIFVVETKEGSKEIYQTKNEIKTEKLTLKTLPTKVISNKSAIVCAETNIDNEETNVGFEWRKTDAPDVVLSKSALGNIYDGTIEGRISNLNTDSYYKVRAYYEDYNGKRYYGEWIGFDPSDFSYFEPTVHTYAKIDVQTNTAKVRGVALQGTDAIIEQGFEYWAEAAAKTRSGESVMKVQATGQSMEAVLTELDYNTTYNYRAYVKTASGTTYGEIQQFTTPTEAATGINDIYGNGSEELNFAIKQDGSLQLSISGNNQECYYSIANVSGNHIAHGKAIANCDWQTITEHRLPTGIYIITVNNGSQKKAKKFAIK